MSGRICSCGSWLEFGGPDTCVGESSRDDTVLRREGRYVSAHRIAACSREQENHKQVRKGIPVLL
jgi:hypothetical protein